MSNPFVTVVIPTYNAGKFLAECINSVLCQDYPFFEIIVINDGSTDNTRVILEKINDPKVKVVNQNNVGLPQSRNNGLALSHTKYVCFLDSDDYFYSTKLREQVQFMERLNLIASGTQMNYVGESGKVFGVTGTQSKYINYKITKCEYMPFPISSAMFLTEVAKDVGGFDTKLSQVEDLEFLSRITRYGEIHTLMKILGCYRMHENSMSSKKFMEQKLIQRRLQQISQGSSPSSNSQLSALSRIWLSKQEWSAAFFREGGVCILNSRYLNGTMKLILSLILSPGYFTRRVTMRIMLIFKSII